MGKGKKGKRTVSKGKKKVTFRWLGDWTIVWVIGGFALTYFIFVAHEFPHPFHWLFSFLGGIVGYGIGLFVDTGFPQKVVRFVRHSLGRTTLKPDRGKQVKRRR